MPTTENENLSQIPALQSQGKSSSYNFEMGNLLFANGQFKKSLPYVKEAMQIFLEKKDFSSYFNCYFLILQTLNELGEKEEVQQLRQEVEQICRIHNIQNNPCIMAFSAYYNIYHERDFDKAKKNLNEALKTAFDRHDNYIKTDNRLKQNEMRLNIIVCLYVYSIYYLETKDYENCLQEIKNLKILLNDYFKLKEDVELDHSRTDNAQELQNYHQILQELKKNMPKVKRMQLGIKFMEILVDIEHKQEYIKAERLSWELYEEANKTNNTFYIPYILFSMAWCHLKLKNKEQAQMFFNLAEKNVNKERKLLMLYMEHFKQVMLDEKEEAKNYDLVFDAHDFTIVEKHKGCIELKNQFILIDLLKLFVLNPGVSYSKEQIVQKIWKQDYLPEIHDNKIYVTIKRLREMIEVNSCKPRYICRNNAGYHFSKQAKILIKPTTKEL